MRYTKDIAIIVPVTDPDDQTAREAVWQQVTERILPQMGKLCTRFEPSAGAWGQKLSSPYSVILGRNEPALFLYFYASAKHQLDERAKAHLAGFMEHLEIGNEQTVGDTKMCTAYLKGDTAEARSHMEWRADAGLRDLLPARRPVVSEGGRASEDPLQYEGVCHLRGEAGMGGHT